MRPVHNTRARPARGALLLAGRHPGGLGQIAFLEAEVDGHLISTHALVLENIRKDEDGRPIEILFGAQAMQQWGIRPVPDEERLDLTHYPEEFVEF